MNQIPQLKCMIANHLNKRIISVCMNQKCLKERICCLICLQEEHSDHNKDWVDFENFFVSDDDITADTYAKDNVFQTFLKYFRDNTPIEDIINEIVDKSKNKLINQIEILRSELLQYAKDQKQESGNRDELKEIYRKLYSLSEIKQSIIENSQKQQINQISQDIQKFINSQERTDTKIVLDEKLGQQKVFQIDHDAILKQENIIIQEIQNIKKTIYYGYILESPFLKFDDWGTIKSFFSKPKKFNLLMSGSRNGLNGQQLYQKIQNKGQLLFIFESKVHQQVFGAYSTCNWGSFKGNYKSCNEAFLFSLTHKIKFNIINQTYAYYEDGQNQFAFGGGHDLCIYLNFGSSCYSNLAHSYQHDQKKTSLAGGYNFEIKDFEVYQISDE